MKFTTKAKYCAAIDIGSTYSGYAFSSKDEFLKEPTKININYWPGSALMSVKTPTSLLLDESQNFLSFGYDAENQFSDLLYDGKHEKYFYFHNFKMLLHTRDRTVSDYK